MAFGRWRCCNVTLTPNVQPHVTDASFCGVVSRLSPLKYESRLLQRRGEGRTLCLTRGRQRLSTGVSLLSFTACACPCRATSISAARRHFTSPSPRRVCRELAAPTVPIMYPCRKECLNWSLTRLHSGRSAKGRPGVGQPTDRSMRADLEREEGSASKHRISCDCDPRFDVRHRAPCSMRLWSPLRHPASFPLPNHNHLSSPPNHRASEYQVIKSVESSA